MYTSMTSSTSSPLTTNVGSGKSTEETSESKEVNAAATSKKASATKATANSDSVNFSSRAMKIQSIAKDFFSGGQLSLADIPKYIKRLESDGFLTGAQAEKLGVTGGQKTDELADETTKVLDFIDSFKKKVGEKDPQDGLIGALDRAKKTIEKLGDGHDSSMAADVKVSLLEIDSYLNSDKAKQWDEQDIKALKDVKNVLSVTNQLHFQQTSSTAVNRYLQFAGNAY